MSLRNVNALLVTLAVAGASVAACAVDANDASPEAVGTVRQASSTSPPYLTKKTAALLGLSASQALTETQQYYQTWGAPTTLAQFESTFGFNAPGAQIAGAVYYNAHDLGIGRAMRCLEQASGLRACYVDNYGTFGGDSTTALNDAAHRANLLATVAMVFNPSLGANAVNFVAYDGTGKQSPIAKLDTTGINTNIPFNCLNCHGGSYDLSGHKATGAHFLAFDLDTFEYGNFAGYRRQDQLDQFRQLNAHVYAIAQSQSNTPMVQTIDGWYGGAGRVNTAGATFDGNFVPTSWAGATQSDMYRQVIAPYCRSCHLANAPDLNAAAGVLPQSPNPTSLAIQDLCNNFNMPLAEKPMELFWNDPNAQLKVLDATNQVCNTKPTYVSTTPPPPPPPPPGGNPNPTCDTNNYDDGKCYGSQQWQQWAGQQCQHKGEHLGHWQLSQPCGNNFYRAGQYQCCK